ncbi:MAG: RlmE family RNA methyltransferase [Candidatus Thorarchaeota archaeon]
MGRPLDERRKEHYYRAAKKHGYRSRSAYKLKQIARLHGLLKGVKKVLELCSCPGGWTQVLREMDESLQIVAVDIEEMREIEGVVFIRGDITDLQTQSEIRRLTGGSVDLILSDCSPRVSGNWDLDVARQLSLAETTMILGTSLLRPGGRVLAKVFQGPGFQNFLEFVRSNYGSVKLIKPDASRKTSAEIYVLASNPTRNSNTGIY